MSRRLACALVVAVIAVLSMTLSGADAARRCVGVRVWWKGEELTYIGPVCFWWPSDASAPASVEVGPPGSSPSGSPSPSPSPSPDA